MPCLLKFYLNARKTLVADRPTIPQFSAFNPLLHLPTPFLLAIPQTTPPFLFYSQLTLSLLIQAASNFVAPLAILPTVPTPMPTLYKQLAKMVAQPTVALPTVPTLMPTPNPPIAQTVALPVALSMIASTPQPKPIIVQPAA